MPSTGFWGTQLGTLLIVIGGVVLLFLFIMSGFVIPDWREKRRERRRRKRAQP
jgi:lipopolysaccharide export LptBFGC system permease protein LptF